MKPTFIRINDINDIDTSKISVYDLNNRYIDREGNMFGLKYNTGSKKVEIIKIVRAVDRDASNMQQQIIEKKLSDVDNYTMDAAPEEYDEPPETVYHDDSSFDPDIFINDCIILMKTHRERLKGIIMNIKNSNIFPKENKADSIELDNIFRNIEIDGDMSFEQVESYQKELQSYPRSITYYQAKIDKKGNEVIEGMRGDRERIMRFIYLYEMYISIAQLYKNLHNVIVKLHDFIDEKNVDDMKTVSHIDKQSFNDAKTSTKNTIDEIEGLLDNLNRLENYVYDSDNF